MSAESIEVISFTDRGDQTAMRVAAALAGYGVRVACGHGADKQDLAVSDPRTVGIAVPHDGFDLYGHSVPP